MRNKVSFFLLVIFALVMGDCPPVYASGFGLYEASTKAHSLGGAVVGRAVDASANFYNLATLSDFTNIIVTAGFVTEHPRARMKVDGNVSTRMDPGVFWLPHFNLAVPLPYGFTFGLGCWPEYGLGSSYERDWELVASSKETTVMSLTLNPNVSYAITDDWSIGAGLRVLYFDFEQYSEPLPGRLWHRLKGDNRMRDMGWQVGTRYRLLDNLSVGVVYKSWIDVNVKGKSEKSGLQNSLVSAETDMELPQSVTAGFDWEVVDRVHLGGAAMWTQWSSIGELDFNLGGQHVPCRLNWEDTYRFALAPSWEFVDGWTWMGSYAFETDCCGDQSSTMLPGSERHMLATGLSWQCLSSLELSIGYGLIIMKGKNSQAADALGVERRYKPYRGLSHAAGLSVTYRF